ncbi:hypothetical protein F441_15339 [Phytophthora nicotianae CJ01A1]|uniref:Uncharacterized protein n=4 Tax=Phytophthora nicotianae TaxID=4792 RepID=V9EI51_PHYNI|nr:hypothetical protein F443_15511 [Phytophthora nicotianae P1569]ETO67580.1 hypothetical protein F444_15517 [Phytophthora nicotianae P1976]ETP08736.1 hypothetical protein F441_15339 [Phytophthora nicotianae CJ01A1]ETP36766.1 hypothetical protein F442_15367 [Phytophthora nicotianae P10297]
MTSRSALVLPDRRGWRLDINSTWHTLTPDASLASPVALGNLAWELLANFGA